MATIAETLTAIDAKTDEFAAKIGEVGDDLAEVKALIETLKADNPVIAAQAQAVLDKLTAAKGTLDTVEADLEATGKGGLV